jgi:hypothetical protein
MRSPVSTRRFHARGALMLALLRGMANTIDRVRSRGSRTVESPMVIVLVASIVPLLTILSLVIGSVAMGCGSSG